MSDVTRILSEIESGDPSAAEKLLPLVYEELRKLAQARMASERADHTLQSTALVHEAYIRLVDVDKAQHWNSRGHFFAAAAEAMRRILVESARRRQSLRQGGACVRLSLDEGLAIANGPNLDDLLDLNDALDMLAAEDPQAAELVKLRVFGGLNVIEAARIAGISKSTAYDAWEFARAWFAEKLHSKQ